MLETFAQAFGGQVWFVLGNHDAYGGSVSAAKAVAREMRGYLGTGQIVELTPGTCLVGHDGWYDARNGDWQRSRVLTRDFIAIQEFIGTSGQSTVDAAQEIAWYEASLAESTLRDAVERGNSRIVFATHVPPYAGATWHEGKISNDEWQPWMSNQAMGDVLDAFVAEHPLVDVLVLCGHTHGAGAYQRAPRLRVLTGKAEYGVPCVSEVFRFPAG
jgi:hypothetical protein